jgi:hypothetical protein
MQNWKSQCLKKENFLKGTFHSHLQKIRTIKENIKNQKASTVHKNKEIKNQYIYRYCEEMNDLSQKAEKSLNLIFDLYRKFRDAIENLSSSELEELKNTSDYMNILN